METTSTPSKNNRKREPSTPLSPQAHRMSTKRKLDVSNISNLALSYQKLELRYQRDNIVNRLQLERANSIISFLELEKKLC